MKKIISLIASFILLALTTNTIFAQSDSTSNQTSVWKVTKTIEGNEQVVYLGGTIHLLRPSDFPLPAQFEQTYKKVDELFFEVDIAQANSVQAQSIIMQAIMLKNGQTIADLIDPSTYKALSEYLTSVNMQIAMVENLTPEGLALMLTSVEIMKMGFTPNGVDQHFNDKAVKDGKALGFLETFEEQLSFLTDMPADDNDIITYTLRDIAQIEPMMNDMLNAWRSGNELEVLSVQMKNEFPEIYDSLIVQRNANWISKIEQQFLDNEKEFILVGVGHLTGEDSVLQMLKAKGYEIEQM